MIDGKTTAALMPPDYLARMVNILEKLPDKSLENRKVANAVAEFWRASPVKSLPRDTYLRLWDRVWAAFASDAPPERDPKEAVNYAINDPAGQLTEELLKYLWPADAKVGGGLPEDLVERLERIVCRTDHKAIDASSVIVASRAEILHALSPKVAKQHVLPLLNWQLNENAAAYWSAFLWPARLSPDLFKLIEQDCFLALRSPDQFSQHSYEILSQMFVLASMEFKATSEEAVRTVLDEIPAIALEHMSRFLRLRMLNSKDDAAEYWSRTVKPWIDRHWPRDAVKQTAQTRENFAMVAEYSNTAFPDAMNWLDDNGLLGPAPTASTILFSLKRKEREMHEDFVGSSTLPERFPEEVLHLLWLTRPFQWDHGYAKEILERLLRVRPELGNAAKFQSVSEMLV